MDKTYTNGSDRTEEHILVCLSSSPSNKKIVHTAAAMAAALHARFTALYVQNRILSDTSDKKRLEEHIHFAEKLGAEIVTTHGENIPVQIAEYAHLSNVTKIVIGQSNAKRSHFFSRAALTEQLIKAAPDIDIHIIPDAVKSEIYPKKQPLLYTNKPSLKDCFLTISIFAICTLIGLLFQKLKFTDTNIVTIYILGVLLTSIVTNGYLCSICSSCLSVVLFCFFLTEPRMSFQTYAVGYPVTFLIMLISSVLTGTLAAKLKTHANISAQLAFRTQILFDTDRLLQKATGSTEILSITCSQLARLLNRNITAYVAEQGTLSKGQLAIRIGNNVYGVIGIPVKKDSLDSFEHSILLSVINECALAMENSQNAIEKEKNAILAKNEQLRADLLRAISHDLRTPLCSIYGNADMLLNNDTCLDTSTKHQIYTDIYDDSEWLIGVVENLLSITRLNDGRLKFKFTDQLVDEVIAESLRHINRKHDNHKIIADCNELILARMDVRLIIQVLVNLIDNAVKYTPAGSTIYIHAVKKSAEAQISVTDNGPGIPDSIKPHIFEMFYTGKNTIADSHRSLGLGLALCHSIIEAHNGKFNLTDNVPHGCIFTFTLPLSEVTLNE